MPTDSTIIEITDHAVDRYKKLVGADGDAGTADVRGEIRGLLLSASPIEPLWMSRVDRSAAPGRRYLSFGQDQALVVDRRTTPEGRAANVVLSVITYPAVYGDSAG